MPTLDTVKGCELVADPDGSVGFVEAVEVTSEAWEDSRTRDSLVRASCFGKTGVECNDSESLNWPLSSNCLRINEKKMFTKLIQ